MVTRVRAYIAEHLAMGCMFVPLLSLQGQAWHWIRGKRKRWLPWCPQMAQIQEKTKQTPVDQDIGQGLAKRRLDY